jgi:hypothetical protein
MEKGVFAACPSLKNIMIPNRLGRIPELAFAGCRNLTRLTIPLSVKEIGPEAFNGCSSMTSVNIPKSVSLIGYKAFYNCKALEAVELPICIPLIGNRIFTGCGSLKIITLLECDAIIDNSNDNMHIVLVTTLLSSQGLKTIRLPNITKAPMWPHLLRQLDKNSFISRIGVSNVGRKTAIFSFLQQNMHRILEVTHINTS